MPAEQTATISQPGAPTNGEANFKYDVFVSCSDNDADWVRDEFTPQLKAADLTIFDEDRFGFPETAIQEEAVRRSRHIIAILTDDWCKSYAQQWDLRLAAANDPDASLGRLIPVLLKPCNPPLRITSVRSVMFADPVKRPEMMKRLLVQLGRSQRVIDEVTARSAKKGLVALIELMKNEAVRNEMQGAKEAFKDASDQLEILSRYKELHDKFQKTEQPYYQVLKEKQNLCKTNEGWEDLETAARKFATEVESLLAYARRSFPDSEILWAEGLEQGKQLLLRAVLACDIRLLNSALQSLQLVIAGEPSQVDREMVRIAQHLPLDKVVGKLKGGDRILSNFQFDDETMIRLNEFRAGIDALAKLQLSLTAFINNHRCLQKINDLLSTLDVSVKLSAEMIIASWTSLSTPLKKLTCGDESECFTPLHSTSAALDQTLKQVTEQPDETSSRILIRQFKDFRDGARLGFNIVDEDLKRFIGDLRRKLGETLLEALGRIQHE
jgi:hypothetical protein